MNAKALRKKIKHLIDLKEKADPEDQWEIEDELDALDIEYGDLFYEIYSDIVNERKVL